MPETSLISFGKSKRVTIFSHESVLDEQEINKISTMGKILYFIVYYLSNIMPYFPLNSFIVFAKPAKAND